MTTQNKQPNILFIMTDQYRFDCFSHLNHSVVKTPNLDKLISDSIHFSSAYCATMACGPARASVFTGLHAGKHKSLNNSMAMQPGDIKTIPEYLSEAGYDTALVGKLHLKPFDRDYGFRYFLRHDAPYTNYHPSEAYESSYIKYLSEKNSEIGKDKYIEMFTEDEAALTTNEEQFMLGRCFVSEEDHETAWATREAVNYICNEREKDKPFFLNCSYYGPHQPFLCPGKWKDMYDPADIPLPAEFNYETADKEVLKENGNYKRRLKREKDGWGEEKYRKILAAYFGYVAMLDHYIGQLIQTLKDEGLYENTYIILTADHSEMAGQYKLFYKGLPHEGSTHIPFIVRDPASDQNGTTCDRIVSNMDVFATCLKLAGVEIPADSDSRDISLLVAGQQELWDNSFFYKCRDTAFYRKDNCKLIKGVYNNNSLYEYYDLEKDPLEKTNIYHSMKDNQEVTVMRNALDEWYANQEVILEGVELTGE